MVSRYDTATSDTSSAPTEMSRQSSRELRKLTKLNRVSIERMILAQTQAMLHGIQNSSDTMIRESCRPPQVNQWRTPKPDVLLDPDWHIKIGR